MTAVRKKSAQRVAAEALSANDETRVAEAIAALEEAHQHQPNDPKIADQLGDLQVRAGDVFAAVGWFRRAADAFERDGYVDRAVAVWKKVIRIRPELLDVHTWLAELYVRAGRIPDARQVYETMLSGLRQAKLLAKPSIIAIIETRLERLNAAAESRRRTQNGR